MPGTKQELRSHVEDSLNLKYGTYVCFNYILHNIIVVAIIM